MIVTDAATIGEKFLTTGCSRLDAILKGGISCRGITQIYGAAGTGKTQLALQLCLTVQLPVTAGGLGAGNLIINEIFFSNFETLYNLYINFLLLTRT